jgi:Initiator Replication protein
MNMNTQTVVSTSNSNEEVLYKHINAVALTPVQGGRRISLLGRRLFNILLYKAQEEGYKKEYEARLHDIVVASNYKSKNYAPIKRILLELLSTTVEWNSPSGSEVESWDASNLLSGASIIKDTKSGAVTLHWRFDSKIREQLLSPDRYAQLSIESITQLTTHAAMALYEVCARYVDNPSHKTAKQNWKWWHPVLTGIANDEIKTEYRFFKRDIIKDAVAEINMLTNLEVIGPIEFKGSDNKTIGDIQFEVRLKSDKTVSHPKSLECINVDDLPLVGRALTMGVKQADIEALISKYGASLVVRALNELENRLLMPSEKIGPVLKPSSWLKTNLTKLTKQDSEDVTDHSVIPSKAALEKKKSLWSAEWLRRQREFLVYGFQESNESAKEELLNAFSGHLKELSQPVILKQFLKSGWDHRMVRETFMQFIGSRMMGENWDKPSTDDLLGIAAELAQ